MELTKKEKARRAEATPSVFQRMKLEMVMTRTNEEKTRRDKKECDDDKKSRRKKAGSVQRNQML